MQCDSSVALAVAVGSVDIVCSLPTWIVFYLSASSQTIHLAQLDIINKHATRVQVLRTCIFLSVFSEAGRWILHSSGAIYWTAVLQQHYILDSCTPHCCKILSAVSLPANRLSQTDRHAIIQSAGIWRPFFCGVQFVKDAAQMYGASALLHTTGCFLSSFGLFRAGLCL